MAEEIRNIQATGHEAASRDHLASSPSTDRTMLPASASGTEADEAQALLPREIVLRLIEYFKA